MYIMLKLSVSLSSLVGPFRYYVGRVYIKTGFTGFKVSKFKNMDVEVERLC